MKRFSLILVLFALFACCLPTFADGDENVKKFHEAIIKGDLPTVQAMIDGGQMNANSKLIGEKDRPLMLAIISTKPDIVKYLIDKGADVNFVANQGLTPIMNAVGHMPIDIVKLLLEKGAKIDVANDDKMTPLHWAAYRGNSEAIALFLEKGANLKAISENVMGLGGTPLHSAALGNRADAVKLLVEKGASIDEQNQKGYTPLMLAARNGGLKTIETLLSLKANVNLANADKKKAHQIAKERLAEKLESAKKNPKYDEANPPQEIKDFQAVIDLLIKAGAAD
ncbi:MAG TPA: ankyrin repeat domain-containing protein [Candidatus Ozemobacteraceae bacterium]|nr:ankyrin repeat domain-containing protein [Candidatus Ozemobacteraceae bacterium]